MELIIVFCLHSNKYYAKVPTFCIEYCIDQTQVSSVACYAVSTDHKNNLCYFLPCYLIWMPFSKCLIRCDAVFNLKPILEPPPPPTLKRIFLSAPGVCQAEPTQKASWGVSFKRVMCSDFLSLFLPLNFWRMCMSLNASTRERVKA